MPFLLADTGPDVVGERVLRTAPPDEVDRRAKSDLANPSDKRRFLAVHGKRSEGADKSLLDRILGKRSVPRDAASRSQSGGSAKADQLREGLLIALAGSLDEVHLVRGDGKTRVRHGSPHGVGQESLRRNASRDFAADSAR